MLTKNNDLIQQKIEISEKTIKHYEDVIQLYKDKIIKEKKELKDFRVEMSGGYIRLTIDITSLSELIKNVLKSITPEGERILFKYNNEFETVSKYLKTKEPQEFGFWIYPSNCFMNIAPFDTGSNSYLHNINTFMGLYTFPEYPNREIVSIKLMDSTIRNSSKVEVILK